jgi:four helix bundle protein
MTTHNPHPFPHERLDAWHLARKARVLAYQVTLSLPRGFGSEAKQINDAAASVVRNTCEGAGRWKPAEKVHKFEIAQGEASEAAGAVQSLLDLEVGDSAVADDFLLIEARAAATLTGLIRKHRP